MSIEEQRKQAYLRFVVEAKDNGGPFENPELNKGWQIWNAALDSVVIELPKLPGEMNSLSPWVKGHEAARRSDRQAIEAAGLKVKP